MGARRLPVEVRRQHRFRVGAFELRQARRGELTHRTVRRGVGIDGGLAGHVERFGGQLRACRRDLLDRKSPSLNSSHRP